MGKKAVVGGGRSLEIDPFETALDLIVEEHPFEKGSGEVAREENPLRGDEAVFDGFEERKGGLVFDVFFDEERLAGWVGEAGEFVFVGFAEDPSVS